MRARSMSGLAAIAFVVPLVFGNIGGPGSGTARAQERFHLIEATVDGIHAELRAGRLTCTQLVQAYLAACKELQDLLDDLDLEGNGVRARFVSNQILDALSPDTKTRLLSAHVSGRGLGRDDPRQHRSRDWIGAWHSGPLSSTPRKVEERRDKCAYPPA